MKDCSAVGLALFRPSQVFVCGGESVGRKLVCILGCSFLFLPPFLKRHFNPLVARAQYMKAFNIVGNLFLLLLSCLFRQCTHSTVVWHVMNAESIASTNPEKGRRFPRSFSFLLFLGLNMYRTKIFPLLGPVLSRPPSAPSLMESNVNRKPPENLPWGKRQG